MTDLRALVLCSGGMDSAVCAALARERHGAPAVLLFCIDYGARQNAKEAAAVEALAAHLGLRAEYADLPILGEMDTSSLSGPGPLTGAATVVPGRNALFLALAVARATSLGAREVWFGGTATDAAVYPDCRPRFVRDLNHAVEDAYGVEIVAPLLRLQKWEVVREGNRLGVPWELTWSCYDATQSTPCGVCSACWSRQQALLQGPLDGERETRRAREEQVSG